MGWTGASGRTEERRTLETAGVQALQEQRWSDAERLFRQALAIPDDHDDGFGNRFAEGRLAEALIEQGKAAEARSLLEWSLRQEQDGPIPASVWMLADLYFDAGEWQQAEALLRHMHAAQGARASREPDAGPSVLALADYGVERREWEPIAAAEHWAGELGARNLWFEASHRRGALLEGVDDDERAIGEYTRLADHATTYEKTYTRLFILLERVGRHQEALTRARTSLEVRRSANFEEKTRKRILRLERKLAPKGKKPPKREVAAFSVREGQELLEWKAQVNVKGGVRSITPQRDRLLVQSSGKVGTLFAADTELADLQPLREMPRGEFGIILSPDGRQAMLTMQEGRVTDGSAAVFALDAEWQSGASVELGGVISEVATLGWGLGVGSRDGGLYAVDWAGRSLWTHRLPPSSDADAYSRPCPYYVDGAPEAGRVVFSSWGDVVCVGPDGRQAWTFTAPSERQEWRSAYATGSSPAGVASAARLLGIPPDADDESVKAAFRQRAHETHPDTSGKDPGEFVAVRDAYEAMLGREPGTTKEGMVTFAMEFGGGSITSIHATKDGGAWASTTSGRAFRIGPSGELLVSLPAAENYNYLLVDADDRLVAVSDWKGMTIFAADGHPLGGQPTEQLLVLGLSPDGRLITGYGRKELYLFSRSGALLSHVEFSKTIAALAWVGEILYVGAGKLVALVPRPDISLPPPR